MQKMIVTQCLYRSIYRRSSAFYIPPAATTTAVNHHSRRHYFSASPTNPFHVQPEAEPALKFSGSRFLVCLSYGVLTPHSSLPGSPIINSSPLFSHPSTMAIGSRRSFSEDVAHMPHIKDAEIERAFKDLMATSWDELPNAVVGDAENALTKNTDDKAGQEALINVFRAAEAVEEFTGILTSLKMELDDAIGLSGENVKSMEREFSDAFQTVFQRYTTYLSAFGSEEVYLKKKVEMELGSKMIHLKMRCSGLDSEWGKVSILGTSGLAGSYVEHRA